MSSKEFRVSLQFILLENQKIVSLPTHVTLLNILTVIRTKSTPEQFWDYLRGQCHVFNTNYIVKELTGGAENTNVNITLKQ